MSQPGGSLLLLASRSPRRRRLLAEAGVPHEAQEPSVDDGVLEPGSAAPGPWVASLAYLKAAAGLAARPSHQGFVLGADTVCSTDGRILGQPRDRADAERMLRLFEDREHEVLTGVAILERGPKGEARRWVFADRASVRLCRLGPERISDYLDTGHWRGKAGAYNLEERLAAGWPLSFKGDPTTVVGLPMRRLLPLLARLGAGSASGGKAA